MRIDCCLAFVLILSLCVCSVVAHNHGDNTGFVDASMVIDRVAIEASSYITVSNTKLTKTGEWVTVSYNTTEKPAATDVIQVFSPANSDFATHAPVKYKTADKDPNYMSTGAGTMKFRLVNMRNDYVIVFVRSKAVVAVSDVITFSNYNEPLQGHLALTSDPSVLSFMWVTKDIGTPQIKYSTKTHKNTENVADYEFTANAASSTYTVDMLCGGVANSSGWMEPGTIHKAYLVDLKPRTKYFYVYGDANFGWSEEKTFVSPAAVGPDQEINIFAFGDLGKGEQDGSTCRFEEIQALNTTKNIGLSLDEQLYDAVFHIGDISYAVGYASQWDAFFDSIEPLATRVPWMVCPGNHEVDFKGTWLPVGDSFGECGVPYFQRFDMPQGNKPWYSVDLGLVHFVMMSTEHDFTLGSEQNKFIANDLASVDRSKTPWIILSGHRPMYISSTYNAEPAGDQPIAAVLRQHVEPHMFKYGVDVAWWGHNHSYQRSCPAFNNTCHDAGAVHVVIGMAGYSLTHNAQNPPPSWLVAFNDQEYGYTTLSITRPSLTMKFYNEDRVERDSFTLQARRF